MTRYEQRALPKASFGLPFVAVAFRLAQGSLRALSAAHRLRASLTHARLVLLSVPLCSSPSLQTLSEHALLVLGLPHPASLRRQWQSFQILEREDLGLVLNARVKPQLFSVLHRVQAGPGVALL